MGWGASDPDYSASNSELNKARHNGTLDDILSSLEHLQSTTPPDEYEDALIKICEQLNVDPNTKYSDCEKDGAGTVSGLFEALDELGAAIMILSTEDDAGKKHSAVIVVKGEQETEEIVGAAKLIEGKWQSELLDLDEDEKDGG